MANGAIKGITVEIGGNTTKLGKAIGDSEKAVRSLQTELRQVDKLLQFDPGNIDLLNQRQKILTESIAETSKKLNTLKEAESQVVEQFERGEIAENQLRAFQREIMQTEKALNGMQTELSQTEQDLKDIADGTKKAGKASDELGDELDDLEEKAKEASEGFTVMKGAISSLIADGLKSLMSSLKDCMSEMIFETDKAYDNFQAKTGTASEAMGEFEDVMTELYKNNYGESLDDIANAMAEIKQQTQETDPSKLQDLTKNALVLRDTFDFDVKESMRAVNMLTEQFGITGDEAFNLIVQGAQKGLDKNGDLLDTINEYSVHYKQLGYDSDDFFNSLVNGTESGTFSVDKLGDAMKEFGIRVKDTASSTDEGFKLVGLNANTMRKEFAKGGESAQKATEKTLKALFDMDDRVKQNQAGVALFGTMWEDLGVEGVKALMNTNGELDKTKKSMEELDAVKYDNVASKFTQIGRTIQTDLLLPLAEKLLPKLEQITDYMINNSEKVIDILVSIGATIATVFVVNKVATFVQSIVTMVETYKKLKTAIQVADTAQKALNITQSATPWGAIAIAIGAVVAGLAIYANRTKDVADETAKAYKEIDKFNEKSREQFKAHEEAKRARDENIQGIQSEYGYYSKLVDELDSLTDANGKVKKGYEDRANVITSILSEALGQEISTDQLVKQGKQEIIDKINELIKVKEAEAQLSAYEADYTTAKRESTKAVNEYVTAQKNHKKASSDLAKAQEEYNRIHKLQIEDLKKGRGDWSKYDDDLAKAGQAVKKFTKAEEETAKTLEEKHGVMTDYAVVLENYEKVSEAIVTGDVKKINDSLLLLTNNFITAETGTKKSLEQQVKNAKTSLANMKTAFQQGAPGVTKEMVKNAEDLVKKSEAELNKLAPKGKKAGENAGKETAKGLKSKEGDVKKSAKETADSAGKELDKTKAKGKKAGENAGKATADGIKSKASNVKNGAKTLVDSAGKELDKAKSKGKKAGESAGSEMAKGVKSKEGNVKNSSKSVANSAGKELDKAKTKGKKAGENATSNMGKGMTGKKKTVENAGKAVADAGKKGLEKVKANKSGENFVLGFANGISSFSALQKVLNSVANVGKKALTKLKSVIGERSPAKETEKSGINYDLGFAQGIDKATGNVITAVNNMGGKSVDALVTTLNGGTSEIQQAVESITGPIVEETEAKIKAFDDALDEIQRRRDFGLDSEETYYSKLAELRDKHLTTHSDKWIEVTKEIYDYQVRKSDEAIQAQQEAQEKAEQERLEAEEKAEQERLDSQNRQLADLQRQLNRGLISEKEYYNQLAILRDQFYSDDRDEWYRIDDEIFDYNNRVASEYFESFKSHMDEINQKQDEMTNKLSDYGHLFHSVKIDAGDEIIEYTALSDLDAQTAELQAYADALLQLKERGDTPPEFFTMLRDMSVEEATPYIKALLSATDNEYNQYIESWKARHEANAEIAKTLYADEMSNVREVVNSESVAMVNEFVDIGNESAQNFAKGFTEAIPEAMKTIATSISEGLSTISTGTIKFRMSGDGIQQMAKGGIVDRPTVVQVGEDGKEAIVPLEKNTNWINMLARKISTNKTPAPVVVDNGKLNDTLDKIYKRLDRMQMVLDSGALVGELLDKIDSGLANKQLLTERGV